MQLDEQTAKVHRLVQVPLEELAVWDAEHNALGQRIPHSQRAEREKERAESE